jgi:SRSO17 transposase
MHAKDIFALYRWSAAAAAGSLASSRNWQSTAVDERVRDMVGNTLAAEGDQVLCRRETSRFTDIAELDQK